MMASVTPFVGARSLPNNPFDGRTLTEQIEQTIILMQDPAMTPHTAYVDRSHKPKKEE
jgi:IS5 family transposase